MCGDDPKLIFWTIRRNWYSPHAWRWSQNSNFTNWFDFVFSTCVEMILWNREAQKRAERILYGCGIIKKRATKISSSFFYGSKSWLYSSRCKFRFIIGCIVCGYVGSSKMISGAIFIFFTVSSVSQKPLRSCFWM